MLRYVMLCQVMSCHITSHHVTSCHINVEGYLVSKAHGSCLNIFFELHLTVQMMSFALTERYCIHNLHVTLGYYQTLFQSYTCSAFL